MRFELKNRTPSGKASEIVAGLASPSPASNEGSCCKENININKSETSKLNIEPLQMKRKKRGGGYNLRKSLAWDRAFFTEEGVLDPLELSMITGASCRELPVIDEGAPGGSQPTTEPLDLQQLKNYQSKVLESEERRRDCFSARAHSSSSKLASHKVSAHFGCKSVSRYGESLQPVPSSSLKRPATVNAGKAAAKGLKLPKVPGSVTCSSSIRATKSSMLRVNHLKHNQITQPGSKISLKSHKNQTATKHSSSQPTYHPELNYGISSVNSYSSANTSLQLGDNACNSCSKNIAANVNSSSLLHSSESQDQFATFSSPFSQIAQSSGRITHLSQNQNMKPSGLRVPSPSLSFFCQPKASVSNSLSSRDADIDACGSQKPGNSRLRDKMIRTPEILNNITESIKSNSTSICPRSRRFMPSTADVLSDALNIEKTCDTLAEDNKFVDGQTDYLFNKKGNDRTISLENVDFLKVDYEILPQIDNCELEIDDEDFQVVNHSCTVESQSRGSGWRNLETTAEEKNEIHKSDAENSVDEPCEERITFDVFITNYDADFGTHLEDETDYKGQKSKMMQGGCKDTYKPDCCKPFMALTDELKYPPSEIDKRCVETMERAIDVGFPEFQRSSCDEGATSEALKHRPANVRSSDFGSDRQDEKTDSIDVIDDKLQAGEAHIQDTIFALPIPDSKNKVNLVPEVGDDIKESGKTLLIQDDCLGVELDSPRTDKYHTSDGLFSEKRTCFRKSQQEEIVETRPSVGLDRNDRNKPNETNMDSRQTLVEKHDCNSDKVEVIEQSVTDAEVDFVDNSPILIHKTFNLDGIYACKASYFELDIPSRETMQSEVSVNGPVDDGNYLRNGESEKVLLLGPANGNMSEVLYLDNGTMEIDHCSSFPKTNYHEVSQNMYNEVTKPMPLIKDDSQMNRKGPSLSPQEGGFDIDNQRNISDSRNMHAQPPETNELNECCIERWEHLELPNVRSEEEKIFCTNDGLHIKNRLQNQRTASDESLEDDSLGSIFATVAGSNVMHFSAVKNTSISANELSLKSECCNVSDGQSCFVDAITDPASIEPFSDDNTVEIHQETINSIHELHPNSDHDKAKSALATNNNKYGVGHNEKSHPCILPPSTIPFSDEWLTAIEAAGEQILTKKGGAVQNSPPDKFLPEPSPWSPVKKKNNQIGPFDCTKFSNNLH